MESAFHRHQHKPLAGLTPATVVPMTSAGDVDWPGLRRYLRHVAAAGPVALAVTADTAEVAHLSPAEQIEIVTVARAETGLPVIAGLLGAPTNQAVARAEALGRAGADALLVFPTPVFLGARDDVALAYHRALGEAGVPLIAFQLQPALGGTIYRPDVLRQLLALDAVVAVKEASFDRDQFRAGAAAVAEVGTASLLTGNDNFILESFQLGADGALFGFGAVRTAEQVALVAAWQAGRVDESAARAQPLQRLADAVFAPPVGDYRARLKECLVGLGVLDAAHVRPPLLPIGAAERARLLQVLHDTEVPAAV
jgi:4-hydroxy-tetrahydrodipicolinate synthase